MTQTYRTDDFARWGPGQGYNLTPAQVDNNFWDLIQRMLEQEARPDPAAGIAYFEIVGVMMYVHMTDGSVLGPYQLPVAIFRDRGIWVANAIYSKMDTFSVNGGLYVVIWDHTSGTTFNPGANDGAGHNYYQLMIQTPGSSLPSGGAVGHVLLKATTTDYSVQWGQPDASRVTFVPATGSTLTSFLVNDALEELAVSVSEVTISDASDIPFTPITGSLLTSTNVADALEELSESSGGGSSTGRQTMWIPASAMVPNTSNGPSIGVFETTTHKTMVKTLDFDATTSETAQFDIVMPKSWNLGAFRFVVYWSRGTGASGGVRWGMEAVACAAGGALDYRGTSAIFLNGFSNAANVLFPTAESADLPVDFFTGTPVAFGNVIIFRIYRVPSDASDTLTMDTRLHGVHLYYTTNAATDN